jgi:hypothetical protein
MDLPNQASVTRVDLEDADCVLLRVGLSCRAQSEDPHERECEHRQKPQ